MNSIFMTGITLVTAAVLSGCGGSSSGGSTAVALNAQQKYALAYMWHEEKLAYELYLALNEVQPAVQFVNIATKSEIDHMAAVETLVAAYDINITNLEDYTLSYSKEELSAMEPGVFAIDTVQELYDTLYAKGVKTQQDALEVGCMVEVTDVDDLNEYIAVSADHSDIVVQLEWLRSGSYNHYWAFDGALKSLGVSEGCCVLGAEYCKTAEEYPKTSGH